MRQLSRGLPAAILVVAISFAAGFAPAAQVRTQPPTTRSTRGRTEPPRTDRPAPAPGVELDYSRLVRVWDIRSGGRAGEDPYTRKRQAGERMILAANDASAGDLPLLASEGFNLIETASDPLSTPETAPSVWDLRAPDAALRSAREAGLDWLFAPSFAFPPAWYRDQVTFTRIQCLEHKQALEAFSPWEPKLLTYAGRGYVTLAGRYSRTGAFAGMRLGIHGESGEAGLLTGAGVAAPAARAAWQRRFGNSHDHAGWWCADPLARAAFRDAMLRKYRDLDVLNAAWKARFASKEEIAYPASPAAGRRYWLDFTTWYAESVTGLSDSLAKEARRRFPEKLLTVQTPATTEPGVGLDPSLLAKIAAANQVDVRAPLDEPIAQAQAGPFGRLASACRFYGAPFWVEPTDPSLDAIYPAAAGGAKGLALSGFAAGASRESLYRQGRFLRIDRPVVDVAMIFPTANHSLHPNEPYPAVLKRGCAEIRDVLDYEIVDERMIADGALDRFRVAVLWEGAVYEADTLAKLSDWVREGGVLAAYDFGKIETVEGNRAPFADLFGYAGKLAPARTGLVYTPEPGEKLPGRYWLNVGEPYAARYLSGDWYEPETRGGMLRRWTGANARIDLPVDPARAVELNVDAYVAPETAGRRHELLVNGVRVGVLDRPGDGTYLFTVPPEAVRGPMLAVTISSDTFAPASAIGGSPDRRALGVEVTLVQVRQAGFDPSLAAGPLRGRVENTIDLKKLRGEWARKLGRGWTVYFPATRRQLPGYYEVIRYLTYHLSDLDPTKRDAIALDNAWDGAVGTLLSDRALFYNSGSQPIKRTLVLSPEAFAGRDDVVKPTLSAHDLAVEPGGMAAVYFTAPPEEILLQCEKFTALGGLTPATGTAYHPGRGPNHVLIPAGEQIGTRFQVDTPGRYRIFYRALRRGAKARAELLLDGRILENTRSDENRSAATHLAGTLSLSRGVHDLALRPRSGEDVRADFVLLTSDPTIAGYAFAVQPPRR